MKLRYGYFIIAVLFAAFGFACGCAYMHNADKNIYEPYSKYQYTTIMTTSSCADVAEEVIDSCMHMMGDDFYEIRESEPYSQWLDWREKSIYLRHMADNPNLDDYNSLYGESAE